MARSFFLAGAVAVFSLHAAAQQVQRVPPPAAQQQQQQQQQKGTTLEDVLLAACVNGAKYASDNPRQVDFIDGKAQETRTSIVRNPQFGVLVSVVANLRVGNDRRNVRCDFGRTNPREPIEFLAAQFAGRTFYGEPNRLAHPPIKEAEDMKREDRFLGGVYEIMRQAAR